MTEGGESSAGEEQQDSAPMTPSRTAELSKFKVWRSRLVWWWSNTIAEADDPSVQSIRAEIAAVDLDTNFKPELLDIESKRLDINLRGYDLANERLDKLSTAFLVAIGWFVVANNTATVNLSVRFVCRVLVIAFLLIGFITVLRGRVTVKSRYLGRLKQLAEFAECEDEKWKPKLARQYHFIATLIDADTGRVHKRLQFATWLLIASVIFFVISSYFPC